MQKIIFYFKLKFQNELVGYEVFKFQNELVSCLEFGLISPCSIICVRALTVCCYEMHDVMMRQLPNVLRRLSQVSATIAMAIPLMEFLSSKSLAAFFFKLDLLF